MKGKERKEKKRGCLQLKERKGRDDACNRSNT